MTFDNTVTLGGIINVLVMLGGGVAFLISMKTAISVLAQNVNYLTERITLIERDIKILNQVTVNNAVNEEKISSMRVDLAQFMNTYLVNHQQLRKDFELRIERLERRKDP